MATKNLDDNPKISDTIIIPIETPDASGCFSANPYKVDSITIYFIAREFGKGDNEVYHRESLDDQALLAAKTASKIACQSPTADNIAWAANLKAQAEATSVTTPIYFNNAIPVKTVGTALYPAWLSSDISNSEIQNVPYDSDGEPQYGRYVYHWSPKGEAREGDYFVCWTWTPMPAGGSLSAHTWFYIAGDTTINTSIPSHYTKAGKYELLLERYLPEMFKRKIAGLDLTPEVLDKLNRSIAKGFTNLEDLANQIADLLDANSIHESLIPYLSNIFNLKLKSSDPTLWRRQIKRAVPLYKKKGTMGGLREALELAAIKLKKFTKLWQVTPKYTKKESFLVQNQQTVFSLKNIVDSEFVAEIRKAGTDSYVLVDPFEYEVENLECGNSEVTWLGEIGQGDIVLFTYLLRPIDPADQANEDYILSLPLMDLRDEQQQAYPPKNWNVHVIEEDDPMFDVIVSQRHPFQDPVTFGFIRTEFPYSENVYNMEEYNGSTRETGDPCSIDKDFIEECNSCQGSHFTIDLEIQDLSNDKVLEAMEVVKEFVPFHAVMHSMNTSGSFEDFILSPLETVETLIHYQSIDNTISGNINVFFNRYRSTVPNPQTTDLKRNMLADMQTLQSNLPGTAYNDAVCLYSPDAHFESLGISDNNLLEIFAPSPNAGTYTVSHPKGKTIEVSGAAEPVDLGQFIFRLSNKLYENFSASVTADDVYTFDDSSSALDYVNIRSSWDVANDPSYTGGPWTIQIGGSQRVVSDILATQGILITNTSGLPNVSTSSMPYTLKDDQGNTVITGTGNLSVTRRAKVSMPDNSIGDLRQLFHNGDFIKIANSQYEISSFVPGDNHSAYILGYTGGGVGGVNATVYRRRVDNGMGYFQYKGLKLEALSDIEQSLGIYDGQNPPSVFVEGQSKSNFLILIGSSYYKIEDIDGSTITLGGTHHDWKTLPTGGTSIVYSILKLTKLRYLVPGGNFQFQKQGLNILAGETSYEILDRRGGEEINTLTLTIPYIDEPAGDAIHIGGGYGNMYVTRVTSPTKGGVQVAGMVGIKLNTGFSMSGGASMGGSSIASHGNFSLHSLAQMVANGAKENEIKETLSQNDDVSISIEYRNIKKEGEN